MFISKDWLQTYFDQKLPDANRLAELLTMRAFEIEDIKGWDVDDIFDIKVLPDRACYALCHRGIALEISVSANMKLKNLDIAKTKEDILDKPKIVIEAKDQCRRYIGRIVNDVKVKESPEWLRARIESIGERSINNLVDLANFVMFEVNQPMHVFDADKVEGSIKVRVSKKGEEMTTLDGKEIIFDEPVLVIADSKGPLAVAGIKGGKRAEVDMNTKRILIESANFDASSVRKNSKIVDIKTSASKRFESNISPYLSSLAIDYFSNLLSGELKEVQFGPVVDECHTKIEKTKIDLDLTFIENSLGMKLDIEKVENILKSFGFELKKNKKNIEVFVPFERNDIKIKEDLVEEIGRILGYENLPVKEIPDLRGRAIIGKDFYYSEYIKNILNELGFDELSLYTLTKKGFFEVTYPLADDKKFLREDLISGVSESVSKNFKNLPLLGLKDIKVFEIGKVFGKGGEKTHICIGCKSPQSKNSRKNEEEIVQGAIGKISSLLGVNFSFRIVSNDFGTFTEFDITDVFTFVRSPDSYSDLGFLNNSKNIFKSFSQYPFVLRDVAVFVKEGVTESDLEKIIKNICGDILVKYEIFDIFKKNFEDGTSKISYAFHLVFQSDNKTLTDFEVNEIMDKLYQDFNSREGWQVR
jgi:phenylalanyl-tRNA synthetase beta chain